MLVTHACGTEACSAGVLQNSISAHVDNIHKWAIPASVRMHALHPFQCFNNCDTVKNIMVCEMMKTLGRLAIHPCFFQ
jgi:hypothetical protein